MSLLERRKIILQSDLALGDVVVLTAAVRELHRRHRGSFVIDVRTAFPEVWLHNPFLTPLELSEPGVETVVCNAPLVNRSGQVPCHYLYAFTELLNERLRLELEPTEFHGDIHLSEKERAGPSPMKELAGEEVPFWLVSAGGRYDLTIKWWSVERYQEVIDHFRGRIQFIQVGHAGHYHPRLEGVMDLRGRTTLRQLIKLVHRADGVLCGVTALMHLAAAVPRPGDRAGLRPCVVVAGGREAPHWEAYPGHQFIHHVGSLACCREDGCWRARTRPLGDGAPEDETNQLCVDVVERLPRCMHMITPRDVIRRIEGYFEGGATRSLSPREVKLARRATRAAGPSGFEDLPLTLPAAREALESFLASAPRLPAGYRGRGIVICGGGARCFVNAWVAVNALRRVGCRLPIQLWHLGRQEMDPEMERIMRGTQVECVDASHVRRKHPVRRLGGWELKPFAILFSPFRRVLLLDADNVPARDPTFLFGLPEFQETGALFWPDFGRSRRADPVWRSCDLEPPIEPEFESGQILVDKNRCWPALRLALWFNEHSDFYNQYLYGDKDTFSLAFRRLRIAYRLMPHAPEAFAGGIFQHDFAGRRLFQHRSAAKWTLMRNERVPEFADEERCLGDVERLSEMWDGRVKWLRAQFPGRPSQQACSGMPTVAAWMITCAERDAAREATLASLASSDWADLPLCILRDTDASKDRVGRIGRQILRALREFLDHSVECLLLLEDDLIFNRHLRHNVESWRPYRNREITVAGLCNFGFREIAFDVSGRAVAVAVDSVSGAQALLMTRTTVEHVVSAWSTVNGPGDLRLLRLAAQLRGPIYYHSPSLVQHRQWPSTWGGQGYVARDFDAEWRA